MRNVITSGLVAAALGTALIVAGALPASAQVASPQLGLATSNSGSNLLTLVRGGGGGGGGHGGGGGGHMGGGGGHFGGGGARFGGGHFAMGGGGRFAGGRMGMRGENRFNVAHRNDGRFARHDRDDRFRHRFVVRNNPFFFGDGGWGDYAYGGCVIGYDGLQYCPPY
jgi:hypothetical protein